MKIKLIGTGSISSLSASASTLIDNEILVDVGNGIYKRLLNENIDITKIKYIILTHLHGDHCFDIPFLLLGLSKTRGSTKKVTIICSRFARYKIRKLLSLAFPHSFRNILRELDITYINSSKIKDLKLSDNIMLNSFKVFHGHVTNARGFVFKDKKTLICTGDTSYCPVIKEKAKEADYIIIDTALSVGNEAHMGVDNLIDLAISNENVTIIPTHMSINSKAKLLKNTAIYQNVIVPEDGFELDI